MIYVTVGTMFLDFPRLIRKMDALAPGLDEPVVIQTGMGHSIPEHCEHFTFKSRDEVRALQREARLIVCHAGIGAVMDALHAGRPFLVVPRLQRFGEHMDNHQLDLAEAVHRRGWGRRILDIDELDRALADPPTAPTGYRPAREPLIQAIREHIEQVAAALE